MRPSKRKLALQFDEAEARRIQELARAENRTVSSFLRQVLIATKILPGCKYTQSEKPIPRRPKPSRG